MRKRDLTLPLLVELGVLNWEDARALAELVAEAEAEATRSEAGSAGARGHDASQQLERAPAAPVAAPAGGAVENREATTGRPSESSACWPAVPGPAKATTAETRASASSQTEPPQNGAGLAAAPTQRREQAAWVPQVPLEDRNRTLKADAVTAPGGGPVEDLLGPRKATEGEARALERAGEMTGPANQPVSGQAARSEPHEPGPGVEGPSESQPARPPQSGQQSDDAKAGAPASTGASGGVEDDTIRRLEALNCSRECAGRLDTLLTRMGANQETALELLKGHAASQAALAQALRTLEDHQGAMRDQMQAMDQRLGRQAEQLAAHAMYGTH